MEDPWHENDEFWAAFGPYMFSPEQWEKAAAQVEQLLALVQPPAGGAVLDLCCGPGRHCMPLARRGFRVTGVDRTTGFLDEARQRAADEGLDVELVQADMREFVRPDAFDLAINLLTSFGYFEDPEDNLEVLRKAHQSLRPGGKFVLDTVGKEVIGRIFKPREWQKVESGLLVLEERTVLPDWERMRSRWIAIRGDQRYEHSFEHTMYSGCELRALFLEAGFASVDLHGEMDGSPYDQEAGRLVAVAHKA